MISSWKYEVLSGDWHFLKYISKKHYHPRVIFTDFGLSKLCKLSGEVRKPDFCSNFPLLLDSLKIFLSIPEKHTSRIHRRKILVSLIPDILISLIPGYMRKNGTNRKPLDDSLSQIPHPSSSFRNRQKLLLHMLMI